MRLSRACLDKRSSFYLNMERKTTAAFSAPMLTLIPGSAAAASSPSVVAPAPGRAAAAASTSASCCAAVAATVSASIHAAASIAHRNDLSYFKNAALFLSLSCVCPEPVLVKKDRFGIKMASQKKAFSYLPQQRTAIQVQTSPSPRPRRTSPLATATTATASLNAQQDWLLRLLSHSMRSQAGGHFNRRSTRPAERVLLRQCASEPSVLPHPLHPDCQCTSRCRRQRCLRSAAAAASSCASCCCGSSLVVWIRVTAAAEGHRSMQRFENKVPVGDATYNVVNMKRVGDGRRKHAATSRGHTLKQYSACFTCCMHDA